MKSFGLAAALCAFAFSIVLPHSAFAQAALSEDADASHVDAPSRPAAGAFAQRYFIEFRSRSAFSYGHTFVVFGRVGQKLTAKNVAGLHPRGDSALTYLIGHILPVPSETGASDGDLELEYTTARYRIMLSAADYKAIVAKIRHLQANSPAWNAATYNCNAFAGNIAHFAGLTAPSPWMLPEDFVNTLRQMNDGAASAMARSAHR